MVEQFFDFYSPQLQNSRRIWVWTPDDYDDHPERRYSVIYMHDGQNVFDPEESFSGVAWDVHRVLERQRRQKKAIVVAMDSNDDRDEEYDYTARGALYSQFITDTVKPFIDQHYQTMPERESTFLMGASLGALISVEMLWTRPDIFSWAAGLSLPAFYNEGSIFRLLEETPVPSLPIKIYMDHGTRGQDHYYRKSAQAFHQEVLRLGLPEENIVYKIFRGADHTEKDWAERVALPLKLMLKR